MLAYELIHRNGNMIDIYRLVLPDGSYKEYTSFTMIENKFALADVRRFQIGKTLDKMIMEIIL